MQFIIHTDGGARGNPGPAAIGIIIEEVSGDSQQGLIKLIIKFGKKIGETTNNIAEYMAVIEALIEVKRHMLTNKIKYEEIFEVRFYLDSKLVVNQLNGIFKMKDPKLRDLLWKIRLLEQEICGQIKYTHITREENYRADYLVNQALNREV